MTTKRFENLTREKETGSVYTPFGMADDLASAILSNLTQSNSLSILEPAVGDGRLLRTLLKKLTPDINLNVVAYELDSKVMEKTSNELRREFPNISFSFINSDIIRSYIEGHLMGIEFDIIIANPPYLRTQIMGADKSRQLSKLFKLKGRPDIYYVFILIALELLSENGVAGFVTSNRFMKVKAGESLREHLLNATELIEVIDYGDTKLFDAAVLPCTFVFRHGTTDPNSVKFYSIYRKALLESDSEESEFPYDKIRSSSKLRYRRGLFEVTSGTLTVSDTDGTWSVGSKEATEWLKTVDAHTERRFGQLGKIRVGIKTTADKIFILKDPKSLGDSLPELARPLVTHRNAGQVVGNKEPQWMVVYPHAVLDGKRVALAIEDHPKTFAYLHAHREQLEGRKYLKDAGRRWYEIWVPQDPAKWGARKIVFRDIADTPQFWLETTGAVVNGDCYWLDSSSEIDEPQLFLALGVLNSEFITEYYDHRMNNKLFAGKRRFMTQYVEQFPLPPSNTQEAQEIISIVANAVERETALLPKEIERLNDLVYSCFGLTSKKS